MKFVIAAIMATSLSAFAFVEEQENPPIIISVNITTPIPTGLEVAKSKPNPSADSELYREITSNPAVHPYLLEAMKNAKVTADSHQSPGHVETDCSQSPRLFSEIKKDYCAFTASKSFGWWADPVLNFTVEGFIHKDQIK